MTLKDYTAKTLRLYRKHGARNAIQSAANEAIAKTMIRPYVYTEQAKRKQELKPQLSFLNLLRDADSYTLVVLDAGRYDYLAPILRDVFAGEVVPVFSHARDTFEWITKTWQGDFEDVTYLSGMVPVSDEIPDFDAEDFKLLYDGINPGDSIGEIVKLYETRWDNHLATVTPKDVTDAALDYANRDKLVVHYNQPHSPYIGTPQLLGHSDNESATPHQGQPNDQPIWERVRAGDVSDEYLVAAYIGNAVRAVEAIKPLVQEREHVVITADHGEALGEYGMYTHDRAPHPKRRVVPWMHVDGIRKESKGGKDMDINEQLAALGYRQ